MWDRGRYTRVTSYQSQSHGGVFGAELLVTIMKQSVWSVEVLNHRPLGQSVRQPSSVVGAPKHLNPGLARELNNTLPTRQRVAADRCHAWHEQTCKGKKIANFRLHRKCRPKTQKTKRDNRWVVIPPLHLALFEGQRTNRLARGNHKDVLQPRKVESNTTAVDSCASVVTR